MDVSPTPRIGTVQATAPGPIAVTWTGVTLPLSDKVTLVDLEGWIATGGSTLAPLKQPDIFRQAAVGEHGASVTWDADEGDLSTDATHLMQIAREQQPFTADELRAWQAEIGISNSEAAGLLDVSPSTWATYKAGTAPIPHTTRLLCRSILRDPLTLHAWLHPARRPGRPARDAAP